MALGGRRPMTNIEWLTIAEAARYLRISVPGIRKYIKESKLPSYRQGRIVRLKKSDLDSFLQPNSQEPRQDKKKK